MSRVTIYDIAQELALATSTVSRVLNGSTLISEGTSQRIRDTAERLGYQKRRIRRQRERAVLNIKVILPRRQAAHLNLFYDLTDLINGIKQGLAPARANLVCEVEASDLDLFSHKKGGDLDGVIFAFSDADPALCTDLRERDIPFVLLNRSNKHSDFITCDHRSAFEILMQQVIDGLCPRVAAKPCDLKPLFINLNAVSDLAEERLSGMRRACHHLNIGFNDRLDTWTVANVSEIDSATIADKIAAGYNCFICFNDVIAVSVLQKAQASGLRVPQDIALTGFDDSPILQLVSPRICTMSLPVKQIGQEAGTWIQQRVIERSTQALHVHVPSVYKPGESIS